MSDMLELAKLNLQNQKNAKVLIESQIKVLDNQITFFEKEVKRLEDEEAQKTTTSKKKSGLN